MFESTTTFVEGNFSTALFLLPLVHCKAIKDAENNLHDHHERVSFLDLHELLDGFSPLYNWYEDTLRLCSKQLFVNEQSCCGEGNDFKALIFKFMPNGSLEKWLHPSEIDVERYIAENLNLSRRLDTAIDVAYALEYLHNQCKISIIHCDLKPSNILLDEVMVAHVGDFGLAKFLQRNKNNDYGTTNSTSSFSLEEA
ncbi:hypothetical protein Syun_031243 [Stephania yunnanensis]|uniref:non-specific serine/threonine protein kinase n=1 Tax=Stephania yunnanensis TaxID=152371 RepID=A0AAP0E008_9MAGN